MLDIRHLSKTYPGPDGLVTALGRVSLHVAPGEFVAVRGPSGSGKTTLLLAAGGMLHPNAGQVLIGGHDIYRFPRRHGRAGGGVDRFRFPAISPRPVSERLENVLVPALARAGRFICASVPSSCLSGSASATACTMFLPSSAPANTATAPPWPVVLLHRPALVLADEPTGNLDEDNGRIVLEHLADFTSRGEPPCCWRPTMPAPSAHAQRVIQLGGRP